MRTARLSPTLIERYWSDVALWGLLAILYAPLLVHWYDGWLRKSISIEHEYFSHGLIGLPFAAYITWTNRKRWQRLPQKGAQVQGWKFIGAILLLFAGVLYLSGVPDFVNVSVPVLLIGICLWLKGLPGLKLQGFALLLVFLATPTEIPYLVAPYTLPLQTFIAGSAGFLLNQIGMDVTIEGIYLAVGGRMVEVAPYCAGLKMLFTSLYVSLMLLYWTGAWRSRPLAIVFLTSTIALSIFANIIRNTLLTYFHGTGNDRAFVWLHEGWGGDVYSTAMLGILVLLLNQIEPYFSIDDPNE
ncbi:MAG: cyanoexosortase B [Leptolyngbyaceae cyanobacterium CSU_1_3]|nr:cyanoexosortase B [Leptolyngbyaceae cyanobacterium CSU_1_3]